MLKKREWNEIADGDFIYLPEQNKTGTYLTQREGVAVIHCNETESQEEVPLGTSLMRYEEAYPYVDADNGCIRWFHFAIA